jgi:glycosidase
MNEPGATAAKLKMAFAYLATVRGTPMIYYGDEIGMPGANDPDNRRDFPVSAFEANGRSAEEQEIFSYLQKLLALRAKTPALRHGRFEDLAVTEKTWAFARDKAIIVMNNNDEAVDVQVPFADGLYVAQLGQGELRVSGGSGKAHVGGHSVEVYLSQ